MIDQDFIQYINDSLGRGSSKEDIYKDLLNQGKKVDDINQAFLVIGSESQKEDHHKRTIQIIVLIGAILIGAGVFSFIASNWQDITKATKIFIIIGAMLASYAFGWYLAENRGLKKTGNALILLGTIIYGAGIFLVAQMFNIRANWPDGFILWMLGVMFMAYLINMNSLLYLAVGLGFIVTIGHPAIIFGMRTHSFLLTSSFLLIIATVSLFFIAWDMHKKIPEDEKEYY